MPGDPRTFTADRGDHGCRLDLVVRRHLADASSCSRSRVQTWISEGRVAVNGRRAVRAAARTAAGDLVEVLLPVEDRRRAVLPEDASLSCLFEDDHLLVVNKPAGMVSHPTFRHPDGTLMNALLGRARAWPSGQRPSLVGRLDKLTSGVVMVAKTSSAHARLQLAWRLGTTRKTYLAVVSGRARPDGQIDLRLRRDPADRRRVIASTGDGLPSRTRFHRLSVARLGTRHVSLLECALITGRTHQIRVHLAASGLPIVGDRTYADGHGGTRDHDDAVSRFPRQALHAWRIVMDHPLTGAPLDVEAPLPADMHELVEACGLALPEPANSGSLPKGLRRP